MSKRIAFITGATSGIGLATSRVLATQDFKLILCGRRTDRLLSIAKELAKATEVQTLSFDVQRYDQVETAVKSLPESWKQIDVLLNNAGNAHGLDPIHTGSIADWDAMIDSNVKGLLYVTRLITPGMVSRKQGHIINIGSIAGKEVYANGNVYCASKFAVESVTRAMRIDLNPYGIKVTGIHPGLVETEFSEVRFKGDVAKAKKVYQGMQALTAQDVAKVILYVLQAPAHVVLADITLFPTAQASASVVNRKLD